LEQLSPLAQKGRLQLPSIPTECQSNYHLFFAIVPSFEMREGILEQMRTQGVRAAFHYVPLHNSPKGLELVGPLSLPVTEDLSARLVRMPLYFTMDDLEQDRAIATFLNSFENVDHR
jgi:dTDP-4-amino-4,6-dideoxygalactose transaminase